MSSLLLILLSAVLVNLVALTSAPAWRPFVGIAGTVDAARAIALASLLIIPLVSVMTWLLANAVLARWDLEYLRTLAFIAVLLIVTPVIEIALRRYTQLEPARTGFAVLMTTNSAALGVALLARKNMHSLLDAIVFCVGAAAALAVLLLATAAMYERLRGANVPAVFREAPLALVTAGIIALGFMGFSGLIQE